MSAIINAQFGDDKDSFMDKLGVWEGMCEEYENMTGEEVQPGLRCSTILDRAPKEIRTHLRLQLGDTRDYKKLKDVLEEFLLAERLEGQKDKDDAMKIDTVQNINNSQKSQHWRGTQDWNTGGWNNQSGKGSWSK